MAGSIGGGMAHSPERLCGGAWTRLCGETNVWGNRRARAAAPSARGSGSASSGNGHGMGARGLGLEGTMDMVAGTLGLSAPPRLLGTRPLVAPGRTLVLGPGPLAATVAKVFRLRRTSHHAHFRQGTDDGLRRRKP